MTVTLILMRHAKSAWDIPGLPDHDRPLNGRGRRSAQALGKWLKTKGLVPDEVLSSSSTRTGQTYDGLGLSVEPHYTRRPYHADPEQMWHVLADAGGRTVLMLGHNPAISEFAEELVDVAPDHARFWDYPTGATLVVTFEADGWAGVRPGTGRVAHFVIPRELMK